jgi:antirestriction protein ArdC
VRASRGQYRTAAGSRQYIASWLRVLKADKRAIFTAASKAQEAADFMIRLSERTAEVAA